MIASVYNPLEILQFLMSLDRNFFFVRKYKVKKLSQFFLCKYTCNVRTEPELKNERHCDIL